MPSPNAYQRVLSFAQLTRNWRRLFRSTRASSRNTAGSDGQSLNNFSREPTGEIRALARDLESRSFVFSPLKPHLIPKPNGKDRLICVPTVRDRVVQRTLLEFLSKKYHDKLANKISYGFVKGRTVQDAARQACKLRTTWPWVLKTDICSFFDQIDRELLSREMRRIVLDRSLHDILHLAIACEIGVESRSQRNKIHLLGIKEGLGVRQGMPLSPFFSNVVLAPFDCEIQNRNIPAVRYADDLIFFSNSEQGCKQILNECIAILDTLNLQVPELELNTKTEIYEPAKPAEFLGLGISKSGTGYSLRLLDKQRETIRNRILAMGSVKELISQKITLPILGSTIANRVSGYTAAYVCCDNIAELEHELECLRQKVLKRIYREELKIPLAELSAEARAFLDL